jgi:phosphoribosylamine-glycine ligase
VFDIDQHQRDRLRRAEARVAMLEREQAQLVGLLAKVLAIVFDDTFVDPLEYLQRLVDVETQLAELR